MPPRQSCSHDSLPDFKGTLQSRTIAVNRRAPFRVRHAYRPPDKFRLTFGKQGLLVSTESTINRGRMPRSRILRSAATVPHRGSNKGSTMATNTGSDIRYPPISAYGYIADCHSAALVSRYGSIDWCCMPRLDSESCFGRLLGWETGGYCQIAPKGPFQSERRYLGGTLVLETTFRTGEGVTRLIDCFSMRKGGEHHPHRQILRIVEGVEGSQELGLDFVPRFDYGAIKPWIREYTDNSYIAIGGDAGLLISGDVRFEMKGRHHLAAAFSLSAGKRLHVSILWRRPEELDEGNVQVPTIDELDSRLEETTEWWTAWSSKAG
jgi:GH15 family glucan-1,4-alpha-glucosidase